MDVPEKKSQAEAQMEKLSQAVSESWKRTHPVPEKHRALVKQIAKKQIAKDKDLSPEQRQARVREEQKRLAQQDALRKKQERGQGRRL